MLFRSNINIRHGHNFISYGVYYQKKKEQNINFICLNLVRDLKKKNAFSFLLGIKGLVWLENSNNCFQLLL